MTDRVETYGRAFGDPEKGAAGQALSTMQARKLKEIARKSKGEPAASSADSPTPASGPPRPGFGRSRGFSRKSDR